MERQISFRTEQGLYYSYFKQVNLERKVLNWSEFLFFSSVGGGAKSFRGPSSAPIWQQNWISQHNQHPTPVGFSSIEFPHLSDSPNCPSIQTLIESNFWHRLKRYVLAGSMCTKRLCLPDSTTFTRFGSLPYSSTLTPSLPFRFSSSVSEPIINSSSLHRYFSTQEFYILFLQGVFLSALYLIRYQRGAWNIIYDDLYDDDDSVDLDDDQNIQIQLVPVWQLVNRRAHCRLCRRQQACTSLFVCLCLFVCLFMVWPPLGRFDVTRVTFTVPLREHFSLPFIFSQVQPKLSLSIYIYQQIYIFIMFIFTGVTTFTFYLFIIACLQFGSVGHYLAASRESSNETFQLAIIFLTRFSIPLQSYWLCFELCDEWQPSIAPSWMNAMMSLILFSSLAFTITWQFAQFVLLIQVIKMIIDHDHDHVHHAWPVTVQFHPCLVWTWPGP